jgi:hypothetical protein
MRLCVVDLLVEERRALRGVADAHEGQAPGGVGAGVLLRGPRLSEPRGDAREELPPDHADLVQDHEPRVEERLLEPLQLLLVLERRPRAG